MTSHLNMDSSSIVDFFVRQYPDLMKLNESFSSLTMNGLDISAETMVRATNNLNAHYWRLDRVQRCVFEVGDGLSLLTALHHRLGETIQKIKAGGSGEKVFSDEDVYKISNKYNHEHFFVHDNDNKRSATKDEIDASRKRGINATPAERRQILKEIVDNDPMVKRIRKVNEEAKSKKIKRESL